MADALCGPSNPLQNLQKHSQVDRTLQQDRLVGHRQSPSQGFRSVDPRAGSLDAEFRAFENASSSPFQFGQPEFANTLPPAHFQGGWAADFQRLSINEQPVPAGQFRMEAPLVRSTVGGWQNEFIRQRSNASPSVSLGKQAVREPQMNNMNTFAASSQSSSMMMMNNYSQPMFQSYGGMQEHAPEQYQMQPSMPMEQHAQMSDVDFEAAFADAFAHAQEMDRVQINGETTAESHELLMETNETVKIGSDAIHYREQAERTADQDRQDADELARTAGQLLNSVRHDTSEKFQNSQFLELMRRIRDREVAVQDNDLQATGSGSATESATTAMGLNAREHYVEELYRQQGETSDQEPTARAKEASSHFEFPDMDAVYAPTNIPDEADFDPQSQMQALHPGGKWYPDQSPPTHRSQIHSTNFDQMSGAVPPLPVVDGSADDENKDDDGAVLEKRISASDFEYVDESAGLARRFVRGPAQMVHQ